MAKPHLNIQELGRRIKKHDEEAFRILYIEYFSNLRHYAMRYLYDWDEAENLVQEAYFTLWCNLDKYDGERNIIAYLLTYVKNACLKYIRNLKIQDNNQDKIIEAMLFSNITDEEPNEELKHVVERKTSPDIAKELNIAESSVKTHYKRAIALLRKNLCFILFGL